MIALSLMIAIVQVVSIEIDRQKEVLNSRFQRSKRTLITHFPERQSIFHNIARIHFTAPLRKKTLVSVKYLQLN